MKCVLALATLLACLTPVSSAEPPIGQEGFNLFRPAPPEKPAPPAKPARAYPSYQEAAASVEKLGLCGITVCKGVPRGILAMRASEAAAIGYAFCEILPGDFRYEQTEAGTTKYKLVEPGNLNRSWKEVRDRPLPFNVVAPPKVVVPPQAFTPPGWQNWCNT